jgi:hypothetical protein
MNGQKPSIFTPALIGGAVAGILSGIPFLNCLCCLWIIGGAILAAYLLSKDSPVTMTAGDGALVGAFTGLFAAIVHALISIPLKALNIVFFRRLLEKLSEYTQDIGDWRQWFDRGTGPVSISWFLLGLIITAAIFAVLGALGGIIGTGLFGKKTPPPAQPQPPQAAPPQP